MSRRRKKQRRSRKTTAEQSLEDARHSESRPARSRSKTIAFRLIAMSLPFLLLAIINLALYCCDAGYDTRLIVGSRARSNDVYQFNKLTNYAYYLGKELAGPEPRHFRLPKPDDTYRVVVVGASTVEGFPYATEFSFPRHMNMLLGKQLKHRKVEVLNAGIVGINSFAIVDIVRQAIETQPNLIVVYTAHNEFYGPGGVGSKATWISPAVYPWTTHLRRYRFFRNRSRSYVQ